MSRPRWERRLLLVAVVALCLAGAWISGELLKQHAGDLWGSPAAPGGLLARACGAARQLGFDCGGTARSPWAEVQIPVLRPSLDFTLRKHVVVMPVAFLGLAYFVFLGVWFAFIGGPRPLGRGWHRVPRMVAAGGLLASLVFLGLMASGQAPWCLLCLIVHLLNMALVLGIWRIHAVCGLGRNVAAALATASARRLAGLTLTGREVARTVAVALILIAGLYLYRREHLAFRDRYQDLLPYQALVTSLQADPEFLLREFYAQPQRTIPARGAAGSADGRPHLVVFTDYQCGLCYCHALSVRNQVAKAFGGNLAISVRHYPLCRECNAAVESAVHPEACRAAAAAEAARLQGGDAAFWRMHALLFADRQRLTSSTYRELAEQIELDGERLLRDMGSEPVRAAIAADIALARELGVTRTPATFLNGRRLPEVCDTPTFWQAFAKTVNSSAEDQLATTGGDAVGGLLRTGLEP